MAIVTKGSGGSIKFTGTGGSLSITSSGGGGGGGGGGGAPPMTLLGAWFRADDAGSSNGAAVNSWADRSGSGDVLTVPAGKGTPTYLSAPATFNNQPAVSFSSTGPIGLFHGSFLSMASPAAYSAGDSAATIYAVLSVDNHVDIGFPASIFMYGAGGNPLGSGMISLALRESYGNKQLGLQAGDSSTLGHAFYSYNIDSTAKIIEIRLAQGASIGSVFQAVNGATQTVTSWPALVYENTVPTIPSPVGEVLMGRGLFDGKIAEIIYYKKEHDSSERAATLSYLSSRYGISI